MRRSPGILAVALLAAAALAGGVPVLRAGSADATPSADELLPRLEQVARTYRVRATRFTCEERVRLHTDTGREDFDFLYLYVADPDDGVNDRRLVRDGGSQRDVDLGAVGLDAALIRAYSWVFLFEPSRQAHYRYEVEGAERVLGRPAWRLHLEPLPPIVNDVNEWVATVWVDRETSLPLRVEAMTTENRDFRLAYEEAVREGTEPAPYYTVEQFSTDFGVEVRGMRFPSETTVLRRRFELPAAHVGDGRRVFMIRQLYDDYRFFDVRTEASLPE